MGKLKKLDFLSEVVGFEIDKSLIYKTNLGAIVTMLIVIASAILAFMFGKEIYERKIPQVSLSRTYLSESKFVLGEDFPVFFLVSDVKGKFISNFDQYFSPVAYKLNRTNSKTVHFSEFYKVTEKCQMKHFKGLSGKISDSEINSLLDLPYICFNFDSEAVIENGYGFTNSSYINMAFRTCNKNLPNSNCAADLDQMVKEVYVRFHFLNNYVDSHDYNNPLKYYIDVITQQVSTGSLKRNYVRILKDRFISDNGWLLESEVITDFLSFQDVKLEINSPSPSYPNDLYWITVESPQVRNYYFRNYMKIQDLFAKIGGIINAFVIISKVIFFHYLRYKYLFEISEHLLDDNNNKLSENALRSLAHNKTIIIEKHINDGNNLIKANSNSNSNIVSEVSKFRFNSIQELNNINKINLNINSDVNNVDNLKVDAPVRETENNYKKVLKLDVNDVNNNNQSSMINIMNSKIPVRSSTNQNFDELKRPLRERLSKINYVDFLAYELKLKNSNKTSFIRDVLNLTYNQIDFLRAIKT